MLSGPVTSKRGNEGKPESRVRSLAKQVPFILFIQGQLALADYFFPE